MTDAPSRSRDATAERLYELVATRGWGEEGTPVLCRLYAGSPTGEARE